ncbi:MAG: hypothetical protein REI09_11665 [Candidatus Dactylopiibacterium sp.]|nr:hypothetical protein [Candidatus Dactylopiibacterium sp.]
MMNASRFSSAFSGSSLRNLLLAGVASVSLVACGGGDDGGDIDVGLDSLTVTTVNSSKSSAAVGSGEFTIVGEVLTTSGVGKDEIKYTWTQKSGPVQITRQVNDDHKSTLYVTPTLPGSVTFELYAEARGKHGSKISETIVITAP